MTQKIPALRGMKGAISFRGLCGPVVVTRRRKDDQFDYFSAEVNYGKNFGLPESFGGCSGSGLWRLVLSEENGVNKLDEVSLGGIAYYESAPDGGHRFVEFHGRCSIYDKVMKCLADHSVAS
jgi:hypothetical protein